MSIKIRYRSWVCVCVLCDGFFFHRWLPIFFGSDWVPFYHYYQSCVYEILTFNLTTDVPPVSSDPDDDDDNHNNSSCSRDCMSMSMQTSPSSYIVNRPPNGGDRPKTKFKNCFEQGCFPFLSIGGSDWWFTADPSPSQLSKRERERENEER